MRRSEINAYIEEGLAFMARHGFRLPPFAHWSPEEWRSKGPECKEIVEAQLGWDLTDFGSGDFLRSGLFLFTIRNGTVEGLTNPKAKSYAEKVMIVRPGQVTPTHYHDFKMEDIIVRGGGTLVVQLWNSTPDGKLADSPVVVSLDGVRTEISAGGFIHLKEGESVTLPQRLWHQFWGHQETGSVLVGEVSRVNDDHTDNIFLDPVGRFPQIEEDEPPIRLLVGDYTNYYRA